MTAEMNVGQDSETPNLAVSGGETAVLLKCSRDCNNFGITRCRPSSVMCANTCENYNVDGATSYRRML